MSELLLSCQEVSKSFGAAPLFEGLSLGVSEGDHIGVVGPNGSGKSTLLRILAGEEAPSSGTRAARRRLRVGFVPQEPRFERGTTVAGILHAALETAHVEAYEKDTRVAVALSRAGFEDPVSPRRPSRAAGASASPSPGRSSKSPSCFFSTSPRTTSTSTEFSGSRRCSSASPRLSWL